MPKIGFITPLVDWMRQDKFYQRIRSRFESETAARFFKREALLDMLEQHKTGSGINMKKIWSVYCFLEWYDVYFGEHAA